MPASKTVFDALRRLERSASRHLDPDAARHLREEVAAHFEAAVQARMEMGDSREEAERAAVDEFGDIRKIVRKVGEAQTVRGKALDPFFTAALLVGAISYAGAFLMPQGTGAILTLASILICLALCVWASWRVRRLQWRSFLVAAVPVWFCLTAALAATYRTPLIDGEGHFSPQDLRTNIVAMRHSVVVQRHYAVNLETAYRTFQREGGRQVVRDFDATTGALVFGRARNAEFARRSWELTYRELPRMKVEAERTAFWINHAEAALERSWFGELPYEFGYGAAMTGGIFAFFAGGHLLGLFLRLLVEETRRTWRRMRRA